ncbi:type VI secretion protein IcmF/TssM N-terminal domain-containing protein [Desulfovibrio inopinatus]|uniref:type VI secretion protein IcmF/TssM N-terminal domain-containing protein n=1 Tax=Desulfovibrio inopinatus TaxID=102109 RepID=UPI0003FEEEDB|nr:type VI secretion protein IcmF/TssM N-terminal domain-containing protein [Desulfovibrio inopinatus]
MMKFFWTLFKILLFLVLFALAGLAVYILVKVQGWPMWVGAAILFGPIGLVLLIIFIRKWFFRRREKRFVKRVIDQEQAKVAEVAAEEERAAADLQSRFAKAIEYLRSAKLTRYGNPVYALPWHLVIGEQGAGKSEAIKSARLSVPMTDVTPVGDVTPTRNVDFWFLDSIVLIDTAGRYVEAENNALAKAEWREFLTLLSRHRRRDPTSGLTICIPADMLLTQNEDQLTVTARSVRRRVDELMRTQGARFPVYVLITKLDKVPGMLDFCQSLEKDELEEAFGYKNLDAHDDTPHDTALLAVNELVEQLKNLRLDLLRRTPDPDPGVVLFPDAFAQMAQGLTWYAKALFQKNSFQETPFFRGVYFASARQEGEPLSLATGPMAAFRTSTEPGFTMNKGFFLKKFFERVLPEDRRLNSPLREFLTWRYLTRNLAMTSVLALAFFLAGLLTFSYVKNNQALEEFTEDFTTVPALSGDLTQDLMLLARFRQELLAMKNLNQDWIIPRMGFNQSLDAQKRLEKIYCTLFGKGALLLLDDMLRNQITSIDKETPVATITALAAFLAGRINLLDTRLANGSAKVGNEIFQPDKRALINTDSAVSVQAADTFDTLYLQYLNWSQDTEGLKKEKSDLVNMLQTLLRANKIEQNWLVDWANNLPSMTPITMETFWGPTLKEHEEGPMIQPAFTLDGRQRIMAFADHIESALSKEPDGSGWAERFSKWYENEYITAWELFAMNFSSGLQWERDKQEWQGLAQTMSTPQNPYFLVLDALAKELSPYKSTMNRPSWLEPVFLFERVRQKANAPDTTIEKGLAQRVTSIDDFFKQISNIGRDDTAQTQNAGTTDGVQGSVDANSPSGLSRVNDILDSVKSYQSYTSSLQEIYIGTLASTSALALAGSMYNPPAKPAESKSPFVAAQKAQVDLDQKLAGQKDLSGIFGDLLSGPVRFFWAYLVLEAADILQARWDGDVIAQSAHVPESKLPNFMFDKEKGLVWKFLKDAASPFIETMQYGYAPKEVHGVSFPFTTDFINFLNGGSKQTQAVQSEYTVSIDALPTGTNMGAQEEPYATLLTLDCFEKVQKLENYNYPTSTQFTWQPGKCNDTVLTINFSNVTLTKTYSGSLGFPKFLSDFRYNAKTYSASDFPQSADDLAVLGIQDINVNFKITGGVPLIGLLKEDSFKIPQVITHSW